MLPRVQATAPGWGSVEAEQTCSACQVGFSLFSIHISRFKRPLLGAVVQQFLGT